MYFNEENNFFEYENNNDINFNINNLNYNRCDKLFDIEKGFNNGNMFSNIYSKYKNHVYKINVNNDKDKLLYKIQMYYFALKDLNLYLDIFPEDTNILNKYHEYSKILNELKNKYEKTYGLLSTGNSNNVNKWEWINNPWPWDKGENN